MAASLAAGPSFLLCFFIGLAIGAPGEFGTIGIGDIGFVSILLLVSAPIGLFFAGLPTFLGAAVMSWLGWHAPESRSPFVWCAAGAAFAGILSVPFFAFSPADTDKGVFLLIMAFAITGAICAVICRRMTRWPDDI